MKPPVLSIKSITKRFGGFIAVDDVSLEISKGECFGLLGPNGAGKTTLMSLVAGLRKPDSGTISMGDATPGSAARATFGLVPQNIALYGELSAAKNLCIFGELQGLRGAALRERVGEALDAVQLAARLFAHQRPTLEAVFLHLTGHTLRDTKN